VEAARLLLARLLIRLGPRQRDPAYILGGRCRHDRRLDSRGHDDLVIGRAHLFFKRVGWGWAALRPAVVLVAAAVMYLVACLALARGGALWWAVGAVVGVAAIIVLSFAAVAVGEHGWAVAPVLLAGLALLIAAPGMVTQAYLRSYGERVMTTVVERTCANTRSGCVYHYRLQRPDGSLIARTLSPPGGDDQEVGDRVEVVEDPNGLFGPRRVEDFHDTDDLVSLWSAGVIVATFAIATVTGEFRRRVLADPPRSLSPRRRSG
jgi:hypothetical protein